MVAYPSCIDAISSLNSPRSAGWSWRLELELCERKTLLLGWWLEAGAGIV